MLPEADSEQRREFFRQVQAIFKKAPSIDGVIHGVRKVQLGKRGSSRSGYFPSRKNAIGGLSSVYLPMDSRLEARYAMELERDCKVQAFRTQAIQLEMPGGGRVVYPDFLVRDFAGRLHIREVKADRRYICDRGQEDFRHMERKLSGWGVGFAVVDVSEMPSLTKYQNLLWLHQKVKNIPDEKEVERFLEQSFGPIAYGDLEIICEDFGLEDSVLPYALLTERLNVNWECRVDDCSEVWR